MRFNLMREVGVPMTEQALSDGVRNERSEGRSKV